MTGKFIELYCYMNEGKAGAEMAEQSFIEEIEKENIVARKRQKELSS